MWLQWRQPGTRKEVPKFAGYLRILSRRALSEAWEIVFADRPVTVVIGFIVAGLLIYIQRRYDVQTPAEVKDALISGGTSLAIWGAVFLTTFLLHLLYYTPKHNVAELKADRDNVRRQLDSAYDLKTKRCMEVRENMFQRCMEMLKSPEPMLPFHVVVRHEAYNLEDNDDVSWLCDEIGKTSYGHPFAGLDLYVPRSDRKEFLRWIRLFTDYDAISGDTTDYLDAAEEWRHNHGYPEPPAEVRIARLFDKRLRPE